MVIDRQLMEDDLAAHLAGREGADLLPRSDHAQLKSYVIEAHGARDATAAAERLEGAAHDADGQIAPTDDPSLWLMRARVVTETADEEVGFWIDTANPRFWLLHTKTNAKPSYAVIRRLVGGGAGLDVAWLPRHQLRSVQHAFRPFGFRLGFDERPFYRRERDAVGLDAPTHRLNVEHAGVGADDTYELLATSPLTRRAMAVSEVAFWDRTPDGTQILRLSREGRLRSMGASLDSHLQAARSLLRSYETFIGSLEHAFGLSITENDSGLVIEGQPLALGVEKPEGFDFKHLVQRMVSGVEPFRLLGSVEWVDSDLAWVEGVDLHTGAPVRLDLTPSWIRLYLGKGVCGNTLARFVTNLQRSYSADLQSFDETTQQVLSPAGG
jgi:hypothetical protein